ncbi:hypothetical protein ACQ4PT_019811 [Festuca glaucescens]
MFLGKVYGLDIMLLNKVPPLWDSLGLTSAETFAEFCSLLLSRMCAVVSVLVSILECLAARCALPALLYLREVMEDGSALAGVELELPDDGLCVGPRRKFFWGDVWRGSFDAYDQPAIQAISFLQGMYGFVIRDYNYDSAPFTSPLEPSWVGFTLEEAEILKADYAGKSFYGAPDYKCGSCKASFWYQERVKSASAVTERRVVYNNCCKAGKVFVQPFEKPPAFLQELLHFDGPQRSKGFIEKIRQYNCLFAFTSMGATIDRSVNNGGGPNIYKISGNVCHRIGSLLPEEGQAPKFAELYIYHGGDEVDNRIQALNKDDRIEGALDKTIVKGLERMLDAHNPLVKKFRMAKQVLEENEFTDICIRIVGPGESDGPQFNLPSTDELACLVVVEPGQRPHNRADIAVRVYHMKLNEYLGLIKSGKAFGKVTAVLHTVEFQKRGLPHAHILVWRDKGERGEVTPALIDSHVCAEIPDPVQDPLGTYNSVVYESFKDACAATGLLGDDNEWHYAFDEALKWGMGRQLRQLFVTMILFCGVLDENAFFEKYWTYLAEDIQHRIRSSLHDSAYLVPVDELRNMLIEELSGVFARNGCSILDHNLPLKSVCDPTSHVNNMINDELCQDFDLLIKTAEAMQEKLNENQRAAFESIVDRVRKEKPAFFFVSGHGGTGKTFLWNALVAYLRGYQRIVLTVASSGVASLLLPGGRTAHSRFKIPIDLDDNGVCDIRRCTMLSSLIESASLIIWDEALMTHRKCFEALDRTLRDVLSEHDPSLADEPFGGKIVVLGGDLRQILPVIEGGTRSQVVNAAITNSPLWSGVQMEFSLLSKIHKDSNQWTIRVLVSRMWNYRGGTDEGPIIHGDVVLLDKEGNHMYGQLPPATADRLRDVLKEGKVYVIRKFLCNASKPSFRPVESPFMVQFTKFTIAEEQPGLEDDYPFCTYNLCAYTDIPEVGGPPTRFIDVIGRISQVSDLIPVQSSYQATVSNTRTIVLTNLRGDKMRIVLWGDRAIEFDADAVRAMGEREPVIAIFVGTLPKTHRGIRGLSGSSACRWYIDEDIPDINEFRSCLGDQFIPVAPYVSTQPGALPPRVYETPVEMSMAQLSKVDPFTDMEKRFLVTVTIERLGSDQRWFFSSCKSCRKSARFDGYQYQCSGENCGCVAADQTYCLSVFAGDGTDEAEFVFFDRVAAGVVRKQLYTLLRQRYPGHSSLDAAAQAARHDARIPSEITRLVGQKFKLLVCISKKWQTQTITEDLSFQVCKVQETYKPELPALSFAGASGSGGASSSTSGAGMLPVQHTPSTLGSPHSQASRAGYGSPIGQSASPPPNLAPATPTPVTTPKGPSAPRRGAKRSLLSSLGSPAKAKAQLAADNGSGTEDEATIIEPPAQAMVDGAMTVEDKALQDFNQAMVERTSVDLN